MSRQSETIRSRSACRQQQQARKKAWDQVTIWSVCSWLVQKVARNFSADRMSRQFETKAITKLLRYNDRKPRLEKIVNSLYWFAFFSTVQFGPSKTFSLIIGALGRFDDFLSRCEENVVVLAHTHEWKEQQIEGTKSGRTYYVNTGTWIDKHEVSSLRTGSIFVSLCK